MNIKQVSKDSTWRDYWDIYQHNRMEIGHIKVTDDLRAHLVKLITCYPLSKTKQKIFEKLDPRQRAGFMSRYLIKISKKVGVSPIMIKEYCDLKNDYKMYKNWAENNNKNFDDTLYQGDLEKMVDAYGDAVLLQKTVYDLNEKTINLCYCVFEKYDSSTNY